ncbi:MAG: N-acetyl-gamma-glutamyl-phosphate reductase [Chloroflexota bacterium]
MKKVSIVGGSGFTGGELMRLLIPHPEVELQQVTSRSEAKRFVRSMHPNLRGQTNLKFVDPDQLEPCDILFLGMPHGRSAADIEKYAGMAEHIIDLSADFRLRNPAAYQTWYSWDHPQPDWLDKFAYGLPEIYREEIQQSRYVSGVGCNATATNLALLPFAKAGLIHKAIVEVKVGSSEAGASVSPGSHHPIRSGAMRSFAPTGHRHQAEIFQALGELDLHFSATSVEMIRGVLCTAHLFLTERLTEKEVWKLYRETYNPEPFVRIVKEKRGNYRYPEPKIVAGTNFAEVGFEVDERTGRVVVISAIDNLMKGAAGSAIFKTH